MHFCHIFKKFLHFLLLDTAFQRFIRNLGGRKYASVSAGFLLFSTSIFCMEKQIIQQLMFFSSFLAIFVIPNAFSFIDNLILFCYEIG